MSDFSKTLIVDISLPANDPPNKMYKYLCDAASALSSSGGTIIVEQGIYEIDGISTGKYTVSAPSNVSIISHGATIEVTGNVPAFTNADASNERIVIDGFNIKLNYTGGTYTKDIISLSGVSNCEVKKLYFEALTPMSFMTGPPDFAVNGVITIDGPGGHPSNNNTIRFCSLIGYVDGSGYGSGAGVRIKGSTKNTIVRNNFIQYFNACIYPGDGQAGNVVGTIIRGNACTEAKPRDNNIETRKGLGILAWVANGTVIVGNTCQGSYGDGLYLSGSNNCTVSGNIFFESEAYGIHMNATSPGVKENSIVGNVCYKNHGKGMDLGLCAQRNTVFGNVCAENGSVGIYEFDYIENAYHNVVSGNMCCHNDGNNQDVWDIKYGADTDSIFTDNCGVISNTPPS
jgi:parallel beta-helix repeat protein